MIRHGIVACLIDKTADNVNDFDTATGYYYTAMSINSEKNYSRCYNNIGIILKKKGIMMVLKRHIVNQLNLTTLMEIDVLILILILQIYLLDSLNLKKLQQNLLMS